MSDLVYQFDRRLRLAGLRSNVLPPEPSATAANADADARMHDILALAHLGRPTAQARYEALQPELVGLLERKLNVGVPKPTNA